MSENENETENESKKIYYLSLLDNTNSNNCVTHLSTFESNPYYENFLNGISIGVANKSNDITDSFFKTIINDTKTYIYRINNNETEEDIVREDGGIKKVIQPYENIFFSVNSCIANIKNMYRAKYKNTEFRANDIFKALGITIGMLMKNINPQTLVGGNKSQNIIDRRKTIVLRKKYNVKQSRKNKY
jgi:hypothetical protein